MLAAIAFAACGGQTSTVGAGADSGADAASGDSSIAIDAPSDDAPACRAAVTALGSITTGNYCTALVRLSSIDRSILGWSIVCGGLRVANEADARAAFASQLPPFTTIDSYARVGPTGATNDFVFYQPASDLGGIGVVTPTTSTRGKSTTLVFSGQLSWSATGKILYPTSFRPAAEIPAVCAPVALPDVQAVALQGPGHDPAEIARLVGVVGRSALVRAISAAHAIVHTLVVPFPVDGIPMGPPHNEWLVILDSEFLL